MRARVLLADDHQIVREGLRAILETSADIEVVAEAEDGRQTVARARQHCPDVVVMDISMPGLNGIDATEQIMGLGLGVRVVALSHHASAHSIRRMLKAGAMGYVPKACAASELQTAIEQVCAGNIYVSPSVAASLVPDYVTLVKAKPGATHDPLSAREREVLQLVAEGQTTAAIAATLTVSAKTIEAHRKRIMDKLHIRSIAGLTKYAVRTGLTSLGD